MPLHLETPLVASAALGHGDQRVWLKLESLQPSGSFKLRGIGHACEVYAAQGARRLLSSSGGNAGMAVAYAGHALGLPVTVVVPETTGERARALIRPTITSRPCADRPMRSCTRSTTSCCGAGTRR